MSASGWAAQHIERLCLGQEARFRPRGHSMAPHIRDGQMVVVSPVTDHASLVIGDVVLCRVEGREYLHFIRGLDVPRRRALIGNARGGTNGWTPFSEVYGRVSEVQR